VPTGWTPSSVGHRRAIDECVVERMLGVVTTMWARAAAPLAWAGPSALVAGLDQQCQTMDQMSAQHCAADFHIFYFLF
jgi:hypothetical protein